MEERASSSSANSSSASAAAEPGPNAPSSSSADASSACSSSASSSSTDSSHAQPALARTRAPPTPWFPSDMMSKPMRLTVRNKEFTGQVNFIDELKSLLDFKLPRPPGRRRQCFYNGDLATLKGEGSRWLGEIVSVNQAENKKGQPSLYIILRICEVTCWFPSRMSQQEMHLTLAPHAPDQGRLCQGFNGTGRVDLVDEWKSLLHFRLRLPKPSHPAEEDEGQSSSTAMKERRGQLATLQRKHVQFGRRWTGEIIFIDRDEDKEGQSSLDTTLRIHVPPAGEALESMENIVVTVKPLAKLELSEEVVRVGIIGFDRIERFLVELGLQSVDVKIVAICTPMSPEVMAQVWKSANVSIAVKDSETLIFTTRYYEGDPRKEDNDVSVLLDHMEVTVLRVSDQIPWEKANVDFVVDSSTFFNNDKDARPNDQSQVHVIQETEGLENCLRWFPQVLDAFGLYGLYGKGFIRAKFRKGQKSARRAARFDIATCSSAAEKAVCRAEIFPDWNEEPASMFFVATASPAALHRLADTDMLDVDLQVTLAKEEKCSGIESIHTRFCEADENVHLRLKAIMCWCLDIIRCMPIGSCCLKLV